MELISGKELQNGKYRIIDLLGQGGFGITYLAQQVSLGRKVAIKEFFMKEHCNRDETNSFVYVPST
ncbi:MAG: serine/threonine protein kinase, partial [Bacteroidaceae bacterium]|nr:serine/threonine protein kinase [Bacteroidaceae bacterium]